MLHAVATSSQALTQARDLANRFALGESEDRQSEVRALEAQLIAARKRQHAITDFIAASGAQAPQALLGELQTLEHAIHALEARISKAQRPAVIYSAPLLLRVINAILRAQQKPPEQVKPLLQAALTGVHVSPADYRIRFHGIDDVEMRRVELLSEGSFTELSPSAVCDLTFPLPRARRQAQGFSSFMITETRQSLGVLVPRVNDVRNRPRGQAGLASRH